MTEAQKLLLVDDDERFRSRMSLALQERGLTVLTAADARTAMIVARSHPPDLALLDLKMPGGSGLELLRELREAVPGVRIVVLTGYGSIASAVDAIRLGAIDYLTKPADADMVLAAFAGEGRAPAPGAPAADFVPPSLARAEWEHINRVLEDCGGNISAAARQLGMHRRTLQRKLATRPPNR